MEIWFAHAVPGAVFFTTTGAVLRVIEAGHVNQYDGPDILETRLTVNGNQVFGNTEVHCFEQDWYDHHHDSDDNYSSVVLHVVLYESRPGPVTRIPTLSLIGAVPSALELILNGVYSRASGGLPCADLAHFIPRNYTHAALVLASAERLARKVEQISGRIESEHTGVIGPPAQQVCWELCARAAGYGGNETLTESVARRVPLNSLRGLRPDQCFSLLADSIPHTNSRVPGNSKCVRPCNRSKRRIEYLAQLAVHMNDEYWWKEMCNAVIEEHDSSRHIARMLGSESAHTEGRIVEIITNAIAPFLVAEGIKSGQVRLSNGAASLYFHGEAAQHNRHTREFTAVFPIQNALSTGESQGIVELVTNFCKPGFCDRCLVGRISMKLI